MDVREIVDRLREEDGAAASEYAILVALLSAIVAAAVSEFFNIDGLFKAVSDAVKALVL